MRQNYHNSEGDNYASGGGVYERCLIQVALGGLGRLYRGVYTPLDLHLSV